MPNMGVPDEVDGPVRKRPRLSLRASRKLDPIDSMSETISAETASDNSGESDQSSTLLAKALENSTDCIDLTADLPSCSDPLVAPVASLHNLGNTCFLNSMLEVLRYTPGFLQGLGILQREIILEEDKVENGENSDTTTSDTKLAWQVVKNTYSMYKEMDGKERCFKEVATSDASSMAIRPSVLLDNIRELNPMFEGHFQHDAQELLRCLLCYIEDAEKELQQARAKDKIKHEVMEEDNEDRKGKDASSNGNIAVDGNLESKLKQMKVEAAVSDSSGNSSKEGESQGCSEGGQPQKKRGRGRPRKNQAPSACLDNFIVNGGKAAKEPASIVHGRGKKAGDKGSNGGDGSADEVDGHVIANGDEFSALADPTSSSSVPSNRKRKRSRSKSSGRQTSSSGSSVSVGTNSVGLRGGRNSFTVENRKTVNERNGDCQGKEIFADSADKSGRSQKDSDPGDGGGLFHKLQQKLSLKPSSKTTTKPSQNSKPSVTDSNQPSILSMFPLNQIKRLGMTGRVILDTVRHGGRGDETGQNSGGNIGISTSSNNNNNFHDDNNNNEDMNNNHDTNNNSDEDINNNSDNNNNSESNHNSSNSYSHQFTTERERMDTDYPSITEKHDNKMTDLNGYVTVSTNVSSRRDLAAVPSPSSSKQSMHSPSKSPIVLDDSDEISTIPESGNTRFESAIDSVTKKYYSSLCQGGKGSSPILSSTSLSSSPAPTENSTNFEMIVEAPVSKFSPEKGNSPGAGTSTPPSRDLEPEMAITIHSPSKPGGGFENVKVFLSPSKYSPSSCGVQKEKERDAQAKPLFVISSSKSARETGNHVTQPLSVSTDLFSATLTPTTRASSLLFAAENSSLLKSSSAPNSPANTFRKYGQTLMRASGSSAEGSSAALLRSPGAKPITMGDSLQPKLELKKCDWLGVSPVRSISAKEALLVLNAQPQPNQGLGKVTSARRRILCDDSEIAGATSFKSEELTKASGCSSHALRNLLSLQGAAVDSHSAKSNSPADVGASGSSTTPMPCTTATRRQTTLESFKKCTSQPPRSSRTSQRSPQHGPLSSATSANISKSSQGILLRPLSISLDNCDWLLAAKAGQPISAKKALLDMKKCSGSSRAVKSGIRRQKKSQVDKKFKAEDAGLSLSVNGSLPTSGTLVEQLFGGTMMHRTKCLECEMARERQEMFMDISVPVRNIHNGTVDSDDDEDEDSKERSSDSCLAKLMQAFSSVERLKDNNKYFCEQCVHYVEAERSCHYTTLPAVLTLHLKRFSAHSGLFGGVSKLNDKVTIPQNLPCLRYQCPPSCTDPSHRYSLFAIVTHSGMSILHGHYRAYVKVQPHVNPSVFHSICRSDIKAEKMELDATCTAETPETSSRLGHLASTSSSKLTNSGANRTFVGSERGYVTETTKKTVNGTGLILKSEPVSGSISHKGSETDSPRKADSSAPNSAGLTNCENNKYSVDGLVEKGGAVKAEEISDEEVEETKPNCFWLECDDECIKVMEENEFIDKLEEKEGALMGTPYVLFYHKLGVS